MKKKFEADKAAADKKNADSKAKAGADDSKTTKPSAGTSAGIGAGTSAVAEAKKEEAMKAANGKADADSKTAKPDAGAS